MTDKPTPFTIEDIHSAVKALDYKYHEPNWIRSQFKIKHEICPVIFTMIMQGGICRRVIMRKYNVLIINERLHTSVEMYYNRFIELYGEYDALAASYPFEE